MLKTSASFVLDSSKSSTYPRGYASGFNLPAALLDGRFEHSAIYNTCWAVSAEMTDINSAEHIHSALRTQHSLLR